MVRILLFTTIARDWLSSSHRKAAFIVCAVQLCLIALVQGTVNGWNRVEEVQDQLLVGENSGFAICRYGVATLGAPQVDWVDDFHAGWYLSFGASLVSASTSAEFTPVITVKQQKTEDGEYLPAYWVNPPLTDNGLGAQIDARPGALWIVGNEVDRGPDPGQIVVNQGDIFPDIYASAYHDVYHFIKNRDPLAQVANSALVQVTPGRIQYLDIVWQSYLELYGTPMPVDVWNMHLYILPEVNQSGQPNAIANVALGTDPSLGRMESYDPDGNGPLEPKDTCALDEVYCYAEHDDLDVFAEQIMAMRSWMRDHGQQNKPLILSEFSILYPYFEDPGGTCFLQDEFGNCFTQQRVVNFLNASFNYLETAADPDLGYPKDGDRLVQQWLWFSVNHGQGVGFVSNLVDGDPSQMTAVGQAYETFVSDQASYVNLFADVVGTPKVFSSPPGGDASANISVMIRNNGNIAPVLPFLVTFYQDAALTLPIGSTLIEAASPESPGVTGCARRMVEASIMWENLTPGIHRYWVKIDSSNWIGEPDETDNVASGYVLVDPEQAFLPVSIRP